MQGFEHDTFGQRVIVGAGSIVADLVNETRALGLARVLLIADRAAEPFVDRVIAELSPVAVVRDVRQHVPRERAEAARALAEQFGADGVIAIGGGSSVGLAKAIALTSGLPIIVAPTSYAGSEATDVWGITDSEGKRTGHDRRVLPRVVVYDTELTATMPSRMVAASGLNAIAHAVETMWAPGSDPINRAIALEALRSLRAGLEAVASDAVTPSTRMEMTVGTYLSGVGFASAGSGLHHKICHVLGGDYDLPHAEMHAVVLPYVVALNADSLPDRGERLAEVLGGTDALDGILRLTGRLDLPRALREIGREIDVEASADRILAVVPPSNPRTVDGDLIVRLLTAARDGRDPRELAG